MDHNIWLYPFSLVYQAASRAIRRLHRSGALPVHTAPLPLVSVGNITFGGSGKTPLAQMLLGFLSQQGYKPALVSRGYQGRWEKTGGHIPPGGGNGLDWRDTGDEPYLAAQRHPEAGIFIGKDKLTSCRRAREAGFDIAVLDDAFQHHRLRKDVDIVIHSPDRRALKREAVSSLRWADMVLLNENSPPGLKQSLEKKTGGVPVYTYSVRPAEIFHARSGKKILPRDLKAISFLAFCGIARPQRFFDLLNRQGLRPKKTLKFPDHHAYPPSSIQKILHHVHSSGAEAALTTEKDAVKLKSLMPEPGFPLWVMTIRLDIEPGFYQDLKKRLEHLPARRKP